MTWNSLGLDQLIYQTERPPIMSSGAPRYRVFFGGGPDRAERIAEDVRQILGFRVSDTDNAAGGYYNTARQGRRVLRQERLEILDKLDRLRILQADDPFVKKAFIVNEIAEILVNGDQNPVFAICQPEDVLVRHSWIEICHARDIESFRLEEPPDTRSDIHVEKKLEHDHTLCPRL